ncbi:MAG TPA: hypothetical protein VI248_10745 [Kineosporiaceae bacterium]
MFTIVAGVAAVGTVPQLETTAEKSLVVIICFLISILIWFLGRLRRLTGGALHVGSIGVIVLLTVLTVLPGGYLAFLVSNNGEEHIADRLSITYPAPGDNVPECVAVRGDGKIPDEYSLWIFVAHDQKDGTTEFWYGAEATSPDGDEDHWKAFPISAGTQGSPPAGLNLVLIPRAWSQYVRKLQVVNPNPTQPKITKIEGQVWAPVLPPGSRVGKVITVHPSGTADDKSCP